MDGLTIGLCVAVLAAVCILVVAIAVSDNSRSERADHLAFYLFVAGIIVLIIAALLAICIMAIYIDRGMG